MSGTTAAWVGLQIIDTKVKKVEFTRPNLAIPIMQINTYY
jgi:hypothetical protein